MNGNGSNANGSSTEPRPGRFFNKRLRRASFISPVTGERSKRVFTLRDASHRPHDDASESTPLLHPDNRDDASSTASKVLNTIKGWWDGFWSFANSKTGRGIFKCSLAYLLGSLVTFVPALSALIGQQQDSKHMVATVTVWFHPARTIGSMHLVSKPSPSDLFRICLVGLSATGRCGGSTSVCQLEVLSFGQ